MILDTFHDERNGYQFATNPAGAKWDAQMVERGAREQRRTGTASGTWRPASRRRAGTPRSEFPFRTLKFNAADIQTWGVNFERKVRRLNEDSYWSPLPRIYDLQRVSLAGTVEGMRGLRPGRNLRIKPYVVEQLQHARPGSARPATSMAAST